MRLKTFRKGGVHPEENKLTANVPTVVASLPQQAVFPLSQHIGAPAKPVVKKGDEVKVGTLLAEAGGFVSAPIYSSVSGKVLKIADSIDAMNSDRVYRGKKDISYILEQLEQGKGTQFDPNIDEIVISLIKEKKLRLDR